LKIFNVNDDLLKLVHMVDIHGWNLVAIGAFGTELWPSCSL
jgi:hypothetical protein